MDAYVDFAAPGGISTSSRSTSPRLTDSSSEINLRWCLAGERPTVRSATFVHSVRSLRIWWRSFFSSLKLCKQRVQLCICKTVNFLC